MSHFRSIFRHISTNNSYQVSDYGPVNNAFSTFLPSDIVGLTTWLDMADDTVVTSSGGFIDAITNKGTVAFTFRPNTSTARPFLSQSCINARPAAGFDGVDDVLTSSVTANNIYNTAAEAPPPPNARRFTICFAGRLNRINTSNGSFDPLSLDLLFAAPSNAMSLHVGSAFGLTTRLWFDFGDVTSVSNWVRTADSALTAGNVISAVVTYATKTYDLYVNGTYVSGVVRTFNPTISFSQPVNIGKGLAPVVGNAAKMDLGELLVYTGTLTSAEISQVSTYLNDRWGIT